VELNRGLPRAGAADIAHRLLGEANPWHRVGWARHYRDEPDPRLDGNHTTVTWPNDRRDAPIRMKFYAKTAGLLRTEVCLDNREAVLLAAGQGPAAWPAGPATAGAGVAERLAVLARATLPLLDAMAAHAAHLDAPQREVLNLIVALAPLTRAAAPPPPGRAGSGWPGRRSGGVAGRATAGARHTSIDWAPADKPTRARCARKFPRGTGTACGSRPVGGGYRPWGKLPEEGPRNARRRLR
jgi:hypothetical protein